jgi:hypothetical protein
VKPSMPWEGHTKASQQTDVSPTFLQYSSGPASLLNRWSAWGVGDVEKEPLPTVSADWTNTVLARSRRRGIFGKDRIVVFTQFILEPQKLAAFDKALTISSESAPLMLDRPATDGSSDQSPRAHSEPWYFLLRSRPLAGVLLVLGAVLVAVPTVPVTVGVAAALLVLAVYLASLGGMITDRREVDGSTLSSGPTRYGVDIIGELAGSGGAQARTLECLDERVPLVVAQIASRSLQSPGVVTKALARLERRGAVKQLAIAGHVGYVRTDS